MAVKALGRALVEFVHWVHGHGNRAVGGPGVARLGASVADMGYQEEYV
jgi:hypothetical protein